MSRRRRNGVSSHLGRSRHISYKPSNQPGRLPGGGYHRRRYCDITQPPCPEGSLGDGPYGQEYFTGECCVDSIDCCTSWKPGGDCESWNICMNGCCYVEQG